MHWFDQQRELHRALGPMRYWALMTFIAVLIIGYGTLRWWLAEKVGWPQSYGFECSGKGCAYTELWHSPSLLRNPSGYALALFVVIWAFPAALGICLAVAMVAIVRRRWARRRNRIRPMK